MIHTVTAQPSESGQPAEESTDDGSFVRDKNRMSLPSHYRQKPRPALTSDLFNGSGPTSNQLGQPVKALSLSSGQSSLGYLDKVFFAQCLKCKLQTAVSA